MNRTVIPFDQMIEYLSISAKAISRLNQFDQKVLSKIFIEYALYAGGIWKGVIMVSDIEELEEMDVSVLHVRRLNTKEVFASMKDDTFTFLVVDELIEISIRDQRLVISFLIRDRSDRGQEQE